MLDAVGAAGSSCVTGVDPHSGVLVVIPRSRVEEDLEVIAALTTSTTLGEVRRSRAAWLEVASWFHDPDEWGDVDPWELPDDAPYDFGGWFGEDALSRIPLARLRSAELCPAAVMDAFGQDDDGVGFVDYERARWLSPDDRPAIEAALRELGWRVVPDDELIAQYLDF